MTRRPAALGSGRGVHSVPRLPDDLGRAGRWSFGCSRTLSSCVSTPAGGAARSPTSLRAGLRQPARIREGLPEGEAILSGGMGDAFVRPAVLRPRGPHRSTAWWPRKAHPVSSGALLAHVVSSGGTIAMLLLQRISRLEHCELATLLHRRFVAPAGRTLALLALRRSSLPCSVDAHRSVG